MRVGINKMTVYSSAFSKAISTTTIKMAAADLYLHLVRRKAVKKRVKE